MKRICTLLIMAMAFIITLPAKAFIVEEEDGHFVVDIPDNLNQKSVDDDGWTRYANSFNNQHVAYMIARRVTKATPRQLLDKFIDKYLTQQSDPQRGRICGEADHAFVVILYNPKDPSTLMVITYVYNIPYQTALRKFNEYVSCSRYVK